MSCVIVLLLLVDRYLDSAAAISDSGVDSSLGTTISVGSSAAMLSRDIERDCVAETGLGHLSTAWSSGNSSIFVMEGELPRLAEGDGVDDDDDIAPSDDLQSRAKFVCDDDCMMANSSQKFLATWGPLFW